MTTTAFNYQSTSVKTVYGKGFRKEDSRVTVTGKAQIYFAEFMPVQRHPEGQISMSDLIESLCNDDPELSGHIASARKWAAGEFYGSEKTLKAFRLRAGLSQKDLAQLIDTSQPHIAKIEAGKADPQYSTMVKLSNALGVDLNELGEALKNAASRAGK